MKDLVEIEFQYDIKVSYPKYRDAVVVAFSEMLHGGGYLNNMSEYAEQSIHQQSDREVVVKIIGDE